MKPLFLLKKQLCGLIYNQAGPGHYMVLAFPIKGSPRIWVFWKGEITEQGFMFEKKDNIGGYEIDEMREGLDESETSQERALFSKAIDEAIATKRKKRYGFIPFLKPSGRRGEFVFWEDAKQ